VVEIKTTAALRQAARDRLRILGSIDPPRPARR
jgi:hypothetical protein